MQRKGIILAGGHGTRLRPLTNGISKPLLPVYDKPMIYYPLSVLMQAGIRDIAIITTPDDQPLFQRFLGDVRQWGISITWIEQPTADGIAQAYLLAERFLDGAPSALILGDNLFFGPGFGLRLKEAMGQTGGGTIFGYRVPDPERYGVVSFEGEKVTGIVEKPEIAPSRVAVTGLYFLDGNAPQRARDVRPSARGELEIVSLLETYLQEDTLSLVVLGDDDRWFDAGTHESLLESSQAVRDAQAMGIVVGSPEAAAFSNGWCSQNAFATACRHLSKTGYGALLTGLGEEKGRMAA